MAHIPDGVLSAPVLITGVVVSFAGCAHALRRLEPDQIPQTAMLAAVFFIAALIHFPVGPTSVHLILNGLTGVALGWAAFPAILVGLSLQALMFGFGGVIVLGVNTMTMAAPAVLCGALFHAVHRRAGGSVVTVAAAVAGGLGVALTGLAAAAALAASGAEFWPAAKLVVAAHAPVMLIEAAVTAAAVGLLAKVKPDFLAPRPNAMTGVAP